MGMRCPVLSRGRREVASWTVSWTKGDGNGDNQHVDVIGRIVEFVMVFVVFISIAVVVVVVVVVVVAIETRIKGHVVAGQCRRR